VALVVCRLKRNWAVECETCIGFLQTLSWVVF